MEITHICPTYDLEFAHWHEKVTCQQAKMGHSVRVLTTTLLPNGSGTGHKPGRSEHENVEIIRFPAKTLGHQILPIVNPGRFRINTDILHLHSYGQIFPELVALLNPRTPTVLKADVGAVYPDKNPIKYIERELVDVVTGFDDEELGYLVQMGFDQNDIYKIPHGVDFTKFATTGESIDSITGRLLMVAQVIPEKNIELAINTLAEILKGDKVNEDIHLRIVGPIIQEEYHEKLVSLAEKRGVSDHVVFTGLVAHDRIQEEYAKARVLLVTSRSESGGPASMLEATATGRPVVSVPLSLAKELEAGVVRVPYKTDQIADEVHKLLTDEILWEKWANSASEVAQIRDWKTITQNLEDIYTGLI